MENPLHAIFTPLRVWGLTQGEKWEQIIASLPWKPCVKLEARRLIGGGEFLKRGEWRVVKARWVGMKKKTRKAHSDNDRVKGTKNRATCTFDIRAEVRGSSLGKSWCLCQSEYKHGWENSNPESQTKSLWWVHEMETPTCSFREIGAHVSLNTQGHN